ncbi:MAG: hypothetical protein ABIR24_01315 [Verrucomicrobiota bacterium]
MKIKPVQVREVVSSSQDSGKINSGDLSWLDPELFSEVKGYSVFQLEELAIKLEYWQKQLRLAAEQMRREPLANN